MDINEVLAHFKDNEVKCQIVKDDRPQYGDFIAIFGLGNLTKDEIVKVIKENGLLCMFFDLAIRANEREITSSTYLNAEKRLSKDVMNFIGIR